MDTLERHPCPEENRHEHNVPDMQRVNLGKCTIDTLLTDIFGRKFLNYDSWSIQNDVQKLRVTVLVVKNFNVKRDDKECYE